MMVPNLRDRNKIIYISYGFCFNLIPLSFVDP